MVRPMSDDGVRTERLLLRRWRASDRAPFAALNADPRVMEHMPKLLSREESDAFVDRIERHWAEHGFGYWSVEIPGEAECIGFVGLSRPNFESHFSPAVEVGWRIAAEHWGRGYAPEAARAALHFGFTELALYEIVTFTVLANTRSRRVMDKIGFQRDLAGDFEHPRLEPGHPLRPHILYRLRRAQWASLGAQG